MRRKKRGLFSRKGYEPGGEHHVRITDSTFDEAKSLVAGNDELRKHYKELANEYGCAKYEAHDFPVTEILGAFLAGYKLQEEKNGVPENLHIRNIQLGRKDEVEYQKFVEKYNSQLQLKADYKQEKWDSKGIGGKLFSAAAGAAARGIKKASTGKSEDIRWFEKTFANYLCGDSQKAKDYLLNFATEFGGQDEGLTDVAKVIRELFWILEFAKYNRSK